MIQDRAITRSAYNVLVLAKRDAEIYRNPYITPEHVLFQMENLGLLKNNLIAHGKSPIFFRERLGLFLSMLTSVDQATAYSVKYSSALDKVLHDAIALAENDRKPLGIGHLLFSMAGINNSLAAYLVMKNFEIIRDIN